MKVNKFRTIVFILLFASLEAKSQDFQFSQFYNVPLYVNPAFAGSLHTTRIGLHQRIQWPSLDARYSTSVLSADVYFPVIKSGAGLMVMQDYQGGGQITSTEAHLMYSYEINLNSVWSVRPGLQLGYVSRHINYAELRFPHQFDNVNGLVSGVDPQAIMDRAKAYADVSSGIFLYKEDFWLGFSAHHLNLPNQTFRGNGFESRLPMKFAVTAGQKIVISQSVSMHHDKKEVSITPTAHFKWQGESDQLDLGIYGAYNEALVGFWYRGIPIKKYDDHLQNNESIILFVGYKGDPIRVGYSYDFTASRLARARTGGAHEINITYVFHKKKRYKIMKRLPCPSF
jgi:type IX secretion system PorP/SprF family membrane protein